MNLENLDFPGVRSGALSEIAADEAAVPSRLYDSKRFSQLGKFDYPALLKKAFELHDDAWLAAQMKLNGRLNAKEPRYYKSGVKMVDVPYTAAETLSEGEMNRYYARGLCLTVLVENSNAELEVYRAKQVEQPRSESLRLIGTRVKAAQLLTDLRLHPGVDTALGIPAGPNSGISVRIPVRV